MSIRDLLQRSFIGNVLLLGGATAAAPLIVLLAYPALARVYDPAAFGALGVFEAVLAMLAAVCTLRYHQAIPVAAGDDEAASLLLLAVAATAIFSILLALALLAYGDAFVAVFHLQAIAGALWLLPFAVFATGLALAFNAWQIRRRGFARVAAARIAQGLAQAGGQLGFEALGAQAQGLLAGLLLGRVAAASLGCSKGAAGDALRLIARQPLRNSLAAAWHHRRLPLLSSWSAVVNIVGQQASVLILGAAFGPEQAGWYSLAFFVVVGTGSVLGQAIEQSFLARIREAERAARVPALSFAVFEALSATVVAPMMIFAALAPVLFGLAFGDNWTRAGDYAALLAPAAAAAVLGAHLPGVMVLRRRQRAELLYNVVLATARCTVLWWCVASGDAYFAVLAYSVVGTVLVLGYGCGQLLMQGLAPAPIARAIGREVLLGLGVAVPLGWLGRAGEGSTGIALLLGIVAVAVLLARARRRHGKAAPAATERH